MSAIDQLFEHLRSNGRKAFMPFVTAGDPDLDFTAAVLRELASRGSNLCELGIPYSDPIADGPVIQAACERALEHHVSLHGVLDMVSEFRKTDTETPVVLMGYLNPIEAWGYGDFASAASQAVMVVPMFSPRTTAAEIWKA